MLTYLIFNLQANFLDNVKSFWQTRDKSKLATFQSSSVTTMV